MFVLDADNQTMPQFSEEADEWPSIKEVRGIYNIYSLYIHCSLIKFVFFTIIVLFFLGDWSKTGAVFSAEDLALLDCTGRPQQVCTPILYVLIKSSYSISTISIYLCIMHRKNSKLGAYPFV